MWVSGPVKMGSKSSGFEPGSPRELVGEREESKLYHSHPGSDSIWAARPTWCGASKVAKVTHLARDSRDGQDSSFSV